MKMRTERNGGEFEGSKREIECFLTGTSTDNWGAVTSGVYYRQSIAI